MKSCCTESTGCCGAPVAKRELSSGSHSGIANARHTRPSGLRQGSNLAVVLVIAFILALLSSVSVSATIDLIGPTDQVVTSNQSFGFDFYAGMQGVTACFATINANTFAHQSPQSNAINTIQVQGIIPGVYSWNITCSNETTSDTSVTRSFTVDTHAPTISIFSPTDNSVASAIALDIVPTDDYAQTVLCSATWNAQHLETFQVASNTHYAKNYSVTGNGTLLIGCADQAGNNAIVLRNLSILPLFGLQLRMERETYGIGEPARLTIDTMSGANVSIDICPDQQGFVQCTTALLPSVSYPQTITLPYMNKTGPYLVEGIARFGGQTRINQTRYLLLNSLVLSMQTSKQPKFNSTINISASVSGGVPPYRFAWKLHNGTTRGDVSVVTITYPEAGVFNETVTVYDNAGSNRTIFKEVTITPKYDVVFKTIDNQTHEPIVGADIDINGDKIRTFIGGIVPRELDQGTYQLFVSATGYQYLLKEISINSSQTVVLEMRRQASEVPIVLLQSPQNNSAVTSPVTITFVAQDAQSLRCTLGFADTNNWFTPNASMDVSDTTQKSFTVSLGEGNYRGRIDCQQNGGKTGSTGIFAFEVTGHNATAASILAAPTAPSDNELKIQEYIDGLTTVLDNLQSHGPNEREMITLLGFDKQIRNTKRTLQQAARDMNDLQYRTDLDSAAKQKEYDRIFTQATEAVQQTPFGITVLESKTYVRYIDADQAEEVAALLSGLGSMTGDQKALAKQLLPDQQKFTISTKVSHVELGYTDVKKEITVVARSLTYAPGLGAEYNVYEIVPKEVVKNTKDITFITTPDVLKDDTVLRFGREAQIVYTIPRRVDFTTLENTRTVLAKQYISTSITGFAILDLFDFSTYKFSWYWFIIPVLLLIIIYLAHRLEPMKQIQFLKFKLGRKEKVHYLSVLINDANAELDASNYEKAELLYREVRLTYETLSVPAKNYLFEDISALLKRMDTYYFNTIMLQMDKSIKEGQMEQAILGYEKLTGTFSRLDPPQQEQLIIAVNAMARRIGTGVHV